MLLSLQVNSKLSNANKILLQPMNSLDMPVFIVSLSAAYLLSIYCLLKIAEMQNLGEQIVSSAKDVSSQVKLP